MFGLIKGIMRTREMRVELATFTGPTVVVDVVFENAALVPVCLEKIKNNHFYGHRLRSFPVRQLRGDVKYLTSDELNDYVSAELEKTRAENDNSREKSCLFYTKVRD